MKLKTLEQFESKDPCGCGGNCGCGGKPVNEKFSFSKKEVEAAANLIASAISQADMVKAKVHDLEYDKGRGAGFEISIDGEKYEGGSYVVKDNGDVVNAAIGNSHPNAVYNTIGNKNIADVFINMEKYESKNEATVVMDAIDPGSKVLAKLLKKHKVTMVIIDNEGPAGWPEVELTGDKKDLEKVLASEDGWDDAGLADYIEESDGTFKAKLTLEAKKYKFQDIAKAWSHVYAEDMEDEYEGFYQQVVGKYKNKVTKADIATIWSDVYGEEVAVEYDGFYNELKENLKQVAKLEEINGLVEANADGTISDDEDDAVENMLVDVEYMVDELVNYIKVETEKIGGPFRSPGMEAQCLKLVKETFKKHKVRL
ncbi:hypothetical protein N9F93_00070 [bacterium]|nr:hypothetical protein [bacterium]